MDHIIERFSILKYRDGEPLMTAEEVKEVWKNVLAVRGWPPETTPKQIEARIDEMRINELSKDLCEGEKKFIKKLDEILGLTIEDIVKLRHQKQFNKEGGKKPQKTPEQIDSVLNAFIDAEKNGLNAAQTKEKALEAVNSTFNRKTIETWLNILRKTPSPFGDGEMLLNIKPGRKKKAEKQG